MYAGSYCTRSTAKGGRVKAEWLQANKTSLPSCNLGTQIIGDEIQHIVLAPGWPESTHSRRPTTTAAAAAVINFIDNYSVQRSQCQISRSTTTMNNLAFAIAAVGITSALPAPTKVAEFSTPMRGWMTWERCARYCFRFLYTIRWLGAMSNMTSSPLSLDTRVRPTASTFLKAASLNT